MSDAVQDFNLVSENVEISSEDIRTHGFEGVLLEIQNLTFESIDQTLLHIQELFNSKTLNDAPNADEIVMFLCSLLDIENPSQIINFAINASRFILCSKNVVLNVAASDLILPKSIDLINTGVFQYMCGGLELANAVARQSEELSKIVEKELPFQRLAKIINEASDQCVRIEAMKVWVSFSKYNSNCNQDYLISLIQTSKSVLENCLSGCVGNKEVQKEIKCAIDLLLSMHKHQVWANLCINNELLVMFNEDLFNIKSTRIRVLVIRCLTYLYIFPSNISNNKFNIPRILECLGHHNLAIVNEAIIFIQQSLLSTRKRSLLKCFFENGLIDVIIGVMQDGSYCNKKAVLKVLLILIDIPTNDIMFEGMPDDGLADVSLDLLANFFEKDGVIPLIGLMEYGERHVGFDCIKLILRSIEKLRSREVSDKIIDMFLTDGLELLSEFLEDSNPINQEMAMMLMHHLERASSAE